jgi:hypothetical protein
MREEADRHFERGAVNLIISKLAPLYFVLTGYEVARASLPASGRRRHTVTKG